MQSLAALTAEMRALGIKSLALELDSVVQPTYEAPGDQPTEAAPERPEKPAHMCQAEGCSKPNGGVFGAAVEFCELHALAQAGVK